ncbi:MAG: SprT family zinc-dependent metalloprotease [Bdellovibrionales bacterium]
MPQQILLGKIAIEVVLKDIKNVHLSINPPYGRVKIAAPKGTKLDRLRVFAVSKLAWIKKQQTKLREQQRETPREFLERESHYVWGKRYLLKIITEDIPPSVELRHNKVILSVRPNFEEVKRKEVVEQWYRDQLRKVAPRIIAKWEPILRVRVKKLYIQRMRTKWGSCTSSARSIRLNTDLARKPKQCLEYIIVHEMLHLVEPSHNARFVALIDRYLPRWSLLRQQLNSLPVRHENWRY